MIHIINGQSTVPPLCSSLTSKELSIKYVASVGGGPGGSNKDDLLHRPYLIKITTRGGGEGGQKSSIMRQYSLWMASKVSLVKAKKLVISLTSKYSWSPPKLNS
jgi:hypothetical protein